MRNSLRRLTPYIVGLLSAVAVVSSGGVAFAQANVLDEPCKAAPQSSLCKDNSQTKNQTSSSNRFYGPNGLLTKVAKLIAMIAGIFGVIMIIIGAIKYALAGGDAANINSAKNTVLYALVGIVIAAIAQGIILFVLSKL